MLLPALQVMNQASISNLHENQVNLLNFEVEYSIFEQEKTWEQSSLLVEN